MNGGSEQQFMAPLPGIPGIPRMNSKSQEKRVIYDTKLTLVIQEFPIGHEDMFVWDFFFLWLLSFFGTQQIDIGAGGPFWT